jgi:hypothetical protein
VSRLRTERLSIALTPQEIGAIRLGQGGEEGKVRITFDAPAMSGPAWATAADALNTWFDRSSILRGSATLVVSGRFARVALIPWSDHVGKQSEEAALALACFESQYGDMTGWTVRADPGRFGEAKLAFALETEFVDVLRRALGSRSIECRTLRPYFIAAWNRWRGSLPDKPALFAVVESGVATLTTIVAGQWRSLRATGVGDDSRSLANVLEREVLLQGFGESVEMFVEAPGLRPADVAQWGDHMRFLNHAENPESPALAMALLESAS